MLCDAVLRVARRTESKPFTLLLLLLSSPRHADADASHSLAHVALPSTHTNVCTVRKVAFAKGGRAADSRATRLYVHYASTVTLLKTERKRNACSVCVIAHCALYVLLKPERFRLFLSNQSVDVNMGYDLVQLPDAAA